METEPGTGGVKGARPWGQWLADPILHSGILSTTRCQVTRLALWLYLCQVQLLVAALTWKVAARMKTGSQCPVLSTAGGISAREL